MSKQDFIDRLRAALNGKVTPGQVIENVNYYEEYINTQIRMGREEEEVLEELGDPRLIVKSIVSANGGSGNEADTVHNAENAYSQDSERQGRWDSYSYNDVHQEEQSNGGFFRTSHTHGIPRWFRPLLWLLVVVGIIAAIFSVLSFLAPIIIPILVVMFFVKLFRDWLN